MLPPLLQGTIGMPLSLEIYEEKGAIAQNKA